MRVLALAVDVGVAQAADVDSVLDVEVVQIALAGELADAVGGDRPQGVVLLGGELVLLAVDGSCKRCMR
jgi:hypothetical protein